MSPCRPMHNGFRVKNTFQNSRNLQQRAPPPTSTIYRYHTSGTYCTHHRMFLFTRRESFNRFPKKYSSIISDGSVREGFPLQSKSWMILLSSYIATTSYSFSTISQIFFPPALSQQSRQNIFRNNILNPQSISRRMYFTNGKVTNERDPYAVLGLQWGDGATTSEIKSAFRKKARELHPDLNTTDTPEQAHLKFQKLVKAYETLVPSKDSGASDASLEEWRMAIWRQGDRIALDRTDVAGQARLRPAPPAATSRHKYYSRELGHPQGGNWKRGEYLEAHSNSVRSKRRSSSVGTGRNKWVKPKEFKSWNPIENGPNEGKEY